MIFEHISSIFGISLQTISQDYFTKRKKKILNMIISVFKTPVSPFAMAAVVETITTLKTRWHKQIIIIMMNYAANGDDKDKS